MASSLPPSHEPVAISIRENFDNRPFTLPAEAIQKIHDIILSRLPGELVFNIVYSNGTRLHAVGIEKLLSDENPKRRSITEIICSFKSNATTGFDHDRIELTFDAATSLWPPVQLTVSSPDRERVWLMVEELRDHVSNDVTTRPRLPKWSKLWAVACTMFACGWLLLLWGRSLASPATTVPSLSEAIHSTDPNVKLNFLLEYEARPAHDVIPFPVWIAMLGLCALGAWAFMNQLIDGAILPASLFPRSHFLIGNGIERHQRQQRLRSNFFWCVFVALVVGVVAGVLVLLFSPSAKP